MDPLLKAFLSTNFDGIVSQSGVWQDDASDIPDINAHIIDALEEQYERMLGPGWADNLSLPSNPMGLVFLGEAGAGKTHILRRVRQKTIAAGGTFFLADLTDVSDFWATTLQGVVNSLTRRLPNGRSQLELILESILSQYGQGRLKNISLETVLNTRPPRLSNYIDELVKSISEQDRRPETYRYTHVLRAMLLLGNTEPSILQLGEAWLSGLSVRDEDRVSHALPDGTSPMERLEGLTWWSHIRGPSIIAVDQLDAIASEARAAAGSSSSVDTVFTHTTNGLMGLWEKLHRCLVVVSCLEANWDWIRTKALRSIQGRFLSPELLKPPKEILLRNILEKRLAIAYGNKQITPPYPSYPFSPTCFDGLILEPRGLLKKADEYRRKCRRLGEINELESFSATTEPKVLQSPPVVQQTFQKYHAQAEPKAIEESSDSEQDKLLEAAVKALAVEYSNNEQIDLAVDLDFGRGNRVEPLHSRLRVIARQEGDRERHLSLRFIQHSNNTAFQTRLQKAITESGLDRGLPFRRLLIFRRKDLPTGPISKFLFSHFKDLGGILVEPSDDELKTLSALDKLFADKSDDLVDWLISEKPVSHLPSFAPHLDFLFEGLIDATTLTPPTPKPAPGRTHSSDPLRDTQPHPPPSAVDSLRDTKPHPSPSAVDSLRDTQPHLSPSAVDTLRDTQPHPSPSAVDSLRDTQPPPSPSAVDTLKPSLVAKSAPSAATTSRPFSPTPDVDPEINQAGLPIGAEIRGLGAGTSITLPMNELNRHIAVLAAAGSGKTVLLKRMVEEAAIRQVPTIVLDVANDLVHLGKKWDKQPSAFDAYDHSAESAYFENTETIIWTPNRVRGNPISADPLPDFRPLLEDPDEFNEALELSRDLLATDLAVSGKTADAQRAILGRAIIEYAHKQGQSISDLLKILDEPQHIAEGFPDGNKLAGRLSGQLRAQLELNPLMRSSAPSIDFDQMFGRSSNKTRISVVNLAGLAMIEHQQAFVGRFATLLFTYAKKHPAPAGHTAGIIVIDEAKDFVPATKTVASSEPIKRLAAQLRKYGYSLIVATQEPKSIDNKVVANCSTQIFGRALAPATQSAVKQMMKQLGGPTVNLGTLDKGQFYISTPPNITPKKIQTRWCLSNHTGPAEPEEIRALAEASAKALPANGT